MTDSEHKKNADGVTLLLKYWAPTLFYTCRLIHVCSVARSSQLFTALWTVAGKALLSTGFPGKNSETGCHFLFPGIFPTQDRTCLFCLAGGFFTAEPPEKPNQRLHCGIKSI